MKNVKRIYVCSPYTALKEFGDNVVRLYALKALKSANAFYADDRVELFSPVLTNMYTCEHLSHDEAMQICFAQLRSCDELFIGGELRTTFFSKGITMEYKFAKEQGVPVVFEDEIFKRFYEKEVSHAKA
ncbi:DUF7768 domain-containing protein [Campylobacter sp. RM16192]|uniref:DUF7768 domain-containing protein n=1 Tax=Campylobacter sp. RM16192 TaxID=1660080 RepID=UPI0014512CA1|nr:DUF4406 domain-containing protein [Campylobacter sp. RM16192]QCD52678.1 putative protein (DUF4406 domain) [Campylobacter sp. RM16192]